MTWFRKASVIRWAAPVAVAAMLVGGTFAVNAVTASAGAQTLPVRTAGQLLADVATVQLKAFSGTLVQTSDLGIPSVPGLAGASSSDLESLVSGTHTLRVWFDGTGKARLALLGTLGETDLIKNGSDLWIWSSQDNTASHRTIGDSTLPDSPASAVAALGSSGLVESPQQLAAAVLRAVGPSTLVTVGDSETVAGRAAYQLDVSPKTTGGSLLSTVRIAIDGQTHIPLGVQVFAVGHSDPALDIAFSSVDFSTPDPAQFVFNPPPGAQVTQGEGATPGAVRTTRGKDRPDKVPSVAVRTHLVGSGWTSVVVGPSSGLPFAGQLGSVLGSLPRVSGAWGSGRLLAGTLFSVVITDGGEFAVGAVSPDVLYSALASR